MVVRPAEKRTPGQTAFLDQLSQSDPTVATACTLAQAFGQLLHKLEGAARLDHWKAAVLANGCTEPWSNGMVEGFITKVKWIKRSSYGQAGFPLLQRRVLLHPAQQAKTGRHPEDKQDTPACSLSRAEEAATREQLIA
jgi:hypothetical protein